MHNFFFFWKSGPDLEQLSQQRAVTTESLLNLVMRWVVEADVQGY